jgi:tetratricopeptide (TPR) repeat protein
MRVNQGWKAIIVTGLALSAAACNSQRALPAVQEAGDRNVQRQNYDAAFTDYSEYIAREPGDPVVQLKMAKTLIELGRPAEAVEHAQLAYDQRTNNNDCIETLARALFDAGRQEDCFRVLRSVADGRGLSGDHIRLGRFLALAGDADGAEHSLKQAARIDGGKTIEPQIALADFYHQIGDRASELKRLRMALFIAPNNADIAKRIRDLGEVPGPSLALTPEESGN